MRDSGITVINAPSDLGLRRTGVQGLPDALRAAGLLEGIQDVKSAGGIEVLPYDHVRDSSTGVLNLVGIRTFSLGLAERVGFVLDQERFPLVLGGDCSVLLGTALALRRRGQFGLIFIDGHADFFSPETEPSGEVASMDLAIVVGRDPVMLADLEGRRPFVRESDVVVYGFRDGELAEAHGSPDVRRTDMLVHDLSDVRRLGPAAAARRGLVMLEESGLDGFWVHLDADVLNDDVMPAVDYRMPGGLWPDELVEALTLILASPLAVGMQITIYNPALDDNDRSAGRVLARTVTRSFAAVRAQNE